MQKQCTNSQNNKVDNTGSLKSHLDLLVCRNSLILLGGALSGLIVTGSGRSISLFKTRIYCIDYLLIFVRKLISTEEEHFYSSKLFLHMASMTTKQNRG